MKIEEAEGAEMGASLGDWRPSSEMVTM